MSAVLRGWGAVCGRERGYKPVLKLIFRHFSKGFVSDELEAASSISGHFMAIILALKSALLGKASRIEEECLRYFYIVNNWSYIDEKSKWFGFSRLCRERSPLPALCASWLVGTFLSRRETGKALGEQEEMTLRIDDILNVLTAKVCATFLTHVQTLTCIHFLNVAWCLPTDGKRGVWS